jgi:hypothetical protein
MRTYNGNVNHFYRKIYEECRVKRYIPSETAINFFNFIKEKENKEGFNKLSGYLKHCGDPNYIQGDLSCFMSDLDFLPNDLIVGGDIDLRYTKLWDLPENLTVYGDLYFDYTNISSIPNKICVYGNVHCRGTHISKTYTYVQMKKIFPHSKRIYGGGYNLDDETYPFFVL